MTEDKIALKSPRRPFRRYQQVSQCCAADDNYCSQRAAVDAKEPEGAAVEYDVQVGAAHEYACSCSASQDTQADPAEAGEPLDEQEGEDLDWYESRAGIPGTNPWAR